MMLYVKSTTFSSNIIITTSTTKASFKKLKPLKLSFTYTNKACNDLK